MPKSPEEMRASMIQKLPETTGKSLDEWLKIIRAAKLAKHGEIVKFLKSEHGLTHGYANLIALRALQPGGETEQTGDNLLDAQYAGPKAELKPIYEAIVAAVKKFGSDVEVSPKKTYVSLRRNKQFALIQPTTATRIDVGINLKGEAATERLEPPGSFNAMVSHRVRVSSKKEVDAKLVGWLRKAYEAA